jgi:cell division transport system ATP-binding protein
MIEFDLVTKFYPGGVTALHGAEFRVEPGEFALLTGPNGAGKTTVLKLLYMDERPDEGEIRISLGPDHAYDSGESISHAGVQRLRRRLGVVFQDFKLLPDRNVFENVALALRVVDAPESRVQRRVHEVLALTNLSHKAERLPRELSGGEQQRVAIARAVANEPYLVLADEPTGNLDPQVSLEILRIFQNINASGATILMATHDYDLIAPLPYRRIRLEHGKVLKE